MTERRAWSFLTIAGARQYGGNAGYDDDPSAIYRYDSDVANHLRVGAGDIVIIRSRTEVLGIAEIAGITEGTGHKDRLRCPECSVVNIKRRLTKQPAWGCKNGHLFDEPVVESVPVRTFEAHYGASFRPCGPALTAQDLHGAVLRPSDQMSIKEIDLARIERMLDPAASDLLMQYTRNLPVPADSASVSPDGPRSIIEERRRVLREISLRRGQTRFRERLIRRYGPACQISRCAFAGLVEAAHLRPYARSNDNSVHNGLLLRSDLHTLFDLGLLGVDPASMTVALHPSTIPSGYGQFEGTALYLNGSPGPHADALEERWDFFRSML